MEDQNAPGVQQLKEPSVTGLSVLVNPDRPTLDIVFVHGFTGHPKRTWTHKGEVFNDRDGHGDDGGERPPKIRKLLPSALSQHKRSGACRAVYWPRDLVPIAIPNARVLTYGYDTHIRHWLGPAMSKNTIYDIAWDFLVCLEAARGSELSRPLLFIAHSLGGIVVKEALRRSRGCETHQSHLRSIYESTSGIFFFGTPHGGADPRGLLQHIAEKIVRAAGFSVNEQIVNTLLPSSERLRELREEFGPMARQKNWTVYSFQEQYGIKALNGNKVVDDTASCLNDLGIEITQHIASNHMDMCRFSGPDDVDYGKVVGALNRVLEATATFAPSRTGSVLSADQRRTYLDSLRFNQIDARHATIKAAHAKTCNWLLSKSEYQDWLDVNKISEHHGFLWIKGKAAAGKSTIMKFAYANAKKKMTHTIIVSFFFNARGEDLEKSVLGMYRSLLFQLLEKLPELQNLFDFLGSTAISNGEFHGWDIEILKDIFGRAIKNLGNRCLTCFIDALDECEEDEVREMIAFFEYLGQLAVSSQIRFHICFSSRHYPYITIEKSVQLNLEDQEGHQQDIANYLHSELKAGHSKLVEQIKAEILERASGIFLWVVLVVKMLNKEYDRGRIHALRKRLDEIPNELDELFKDILTRDGQNIEELILCLQWILCAKQPLKCEELYFAILAGVDPEELIAWSPEETNKQDMERFILSSSKGLAEITKSKHQTIQFIHESVRDFLRKNGLNRLRSDLGSNFTGLSHERLKRCCQNYMRIDISEYLPLGTPLPTASSEEAANLRRLIVEKFPFLEYAVRNVLHHADAADGYGISQDSFLESFFLGDWINLNNLFERYQIRRYTSRVSLLYILAEENLPNLIQLELKQNPHMDIKGERHCFPLFAAAAHGNENAVRALLMPDTGAWSDDNILYNHLSSSTVRNCQEATGYVLKNKSEIKLQKDQTFLAWATEEGDVGLVKVLLATRKVDINSRTKNGLTPLWMAAARGHDAVVQLLVAQSDIDVDARDDLGRTPLLRAAAGGRDAVVKLLMGRSDVDVNARDNLGWTPLLQAAAGGHDAVVKLLMGRSDVNVNAKDDSGRTPLLQAAAGGHDAVIRLLIGRSDVGANAKDDLGWTSLLRAAAGGHDAVIKLLMGRSDVNVNTKNNLGSTSLLQAAAGGHDTVIKLLMGRSDVDVNTKDDSGSTPLLRAAAGGHDTVVKLLMGRSNIDVNTKDNFGSTPLLWAAAGGHDTVVKLLMGRSDVDVNTKDVCGSTPLLQAAAGGHDTVIKLLMGRSDVDVNTKDDFGSTPLLQAAAGGHDTVVKLLMGRSDVDVNTKDICGSTPLLQAAAGGHDTVIKLLMGRSDVDVNTKDKFGSTPLLQAAAGGHDTVVKLLMGRSDVDVNTKDNFGRAPLLWAVAGVHDTVVRLLMERSDVDDNARDKAGDAAAASDSNGM